MLTKRSVRISLLILPGVLFLAFLALSPVIRNPFVICDDDVHLLANHSLQVIDGKHLDQMFHRLVLNTYIPLTTLSFSLEYKFFKYQPLIYHLDNLLLHLGVVAMIFLLARRWKLSPWAAGFGALLFGIHPMHVESVAWVTERKDVLYSLFYLLALYHYQTYVVILKEMKKFQESPLQEKQVSCFERQARNAYLLTLFFGILSILSKSMALSLPLILLLIDWLNRRSFSLRVFVEKIPYFFYCIFIAGITYIQHARIPASGIVEGASIWVWTLMFYLKKFFFPLVVTPGYALPKPVDIMQGPYLSSVSILFVLGWVLIRYRNNRWLVFAFAYYLASIFFLLRYDDLADSNIVADRFMYLPSLGLCLWIGELIHRGWERLGIKGVQVRNAGILFLTLVFAALGIKTFLQAKLWGNELKLWTRAVDTCPQSIVALYIRGSLNLENGQYDLALKDFNSAIKLTSTEQKWAQLYLYLNRGRVYSSLKQNDLALADYNMAANLSPDYGLTFLSRGLLYHDQGQKELALADYNRAMSWNPEDPTVYFNRGRVLFDMQKIDLALADFNKAIELRDDYAEAYVSRGNVYLLGGDTASALREFMTAVRLAPNYAGAYYNISVVHYMNKEFKDAWDNALKAKLLGFMIDYRYFKSLKSLSKN